MALPSTIEALLFSTGRQFGGIIPDVTISEQHTDTLTITDHPVEYGAQVSDHAYKNPAELVCKFGWSQQSVLINSLLDGSILNGLTSLQAVYQKLLALQIKREAFAISTGKRLYTNMLLKQISVMTDVESENALLATCVFREVIIVNSQTTTMSASTQASPQQTAPVQNAGTKTPVAVSGNPLSQTLGG